MATFQIHQDSAADKENPMQMPLKEKTTMGAKQPLSVIGGVGVGGIGLKEKKQSMRGNFVALNTNNGNVSRAHLTGAANKVGIREVGKLKIKDENAGFTATNAAALKKSNDVPVVEQFKAFSVYEDHCEIIPQHVARTANVVSKNVEKENYQMNEEQFDIKYDSIHKEYALHDQEGYGLDTTPMSVTDVLSPMSVDRSHLSTSMSSKQLTDSDSLSFADSKQASDDEDTGKLVKETTPRNDRQRFFEVVEYQHNILEYFRESEKKHRPKPQYMRRQSDINYSMRTILVDWLVEVSEEYKLDTETLYLSVSYIDRFLSQMSVVRSKLQLVGTAAMYIASKYEEIYPPDVGEFVFITDDTYNKAQVLRMEQIILKILAFDLCTPTSYVFINTYAVLADIPDKIKNLTLYISELSLLEADPYLRFLPSLISAASLALARYLLSMPIWLPELEEITTYSLNDLKEVLLYLSKSHSAAKTLAQQATREKYNTEKYMKVSAIETIELNESDFDELSRNYSEYVANELAQKHKNAIDALTATATSAKVKLFKF